MNITSLLAHLADEPALTHAKSTGALTTRTYRELASNVGSLCTGLRRLRVRQDDRVLLLSGTTLETLEALLAVFNIGAVAMPVSLLLGTRVIETIIHEVQPTCCIFDDALKPSTLAALSACGSRLICLKSSSAAVDGVHSYKSFIGSPAELLEFPDFDAAHVALIMHTSGSEGRPKRIRMTHGGLHVFLEYNALLHSQFMAAGQSPAAAGPIVSVLPLSHLGGLGLCLYGLMAGRHTYLMSHFIPDAYLKLIETTRCGLLMLVPTMYRALLNEPGLRTTDLSAVQFCLTLGEACSPQFAREIEAGLGATVVSAYGLTECLTGLGHLRHQLFYGGTKPGSCGMRCFGEVQLRDEQGNDSGRFGELWVRNPTVQACYEDRALNESRLRDGWFRTKDLFHEDDDGHFFHRGRCDDMFVCNGKNVYPAELETLLVRHPEVELACAAPVTSRQNATIAAVLVRVKHSMSESEIIEYSASNGPTHTVPQVVHFVREFPEIGPGKINRIEVARLLQSVYDARLGQSR